jgi:7-carboxy-7-deazaguanine synthase
MRAGPASSSAPPAATSGACGATPPTPSTAARRCRWTRSWPRSGGGCRLVELTGGEPLLQHEIGELAGRLLDEGYTVLCETSGSVPVDRAPEAVVRIMDLKCPGSGEADSNDWSNLARLDPARDEIKFVIRDRADYEWARARIEERDLGRFVLHLSPSFGEMEPRELTEWMLEDGLPARLNLQIHKFIWDPATRGV